MSAEQLEGETHPSLADFRAFQKLNEESLAESNRILDMVLGDQRNAFVAQLLKIDEFALFNEVDITLADGREKLERLMNASPRFEELLNVCQAILKAAMARHGMESTDPAAETIPAQPVSARTQPPAKRKGKKRVGMN